MREVKLRQRSAQESVNTIKKTHDKLNMLESMKKKNKRGKKKFTGGNMNDKQHVLSKQEKTDIEAQARVAEMRQRERRTEWRRGKSSA